MPQKKVGRVQMMILGKWNVSISSVRWTYLQNHFRSPCLTWGKCCILLTVLIIVVIIIVLVIVFKKTDRKLFYCYNETEILINFDFQSSRNSGRSPQLQARVQQKHLQMTMDGFELERTCDGHLGYNNFKHLGPNSLLEFLFSFFSTWPLLFPRSSNVNLSYFLSEMWKIHI